MRQTQTWAHFLKQEIRLPQFLKREIPLPSFLRWPKITLPRFLAHEGRFERLLILLYALVAALFGYGLMAAPEQTLNLLQDGSFKSDPVRDSALRTTGAMLGGLSVTLLCLLPMTAPEIRRRISIGLFVTTSLLFYSYVFILPQADSIGLLILVAVLIVTSGILAGRLGLNSTRTSDPQQSWQDQIHEAAAQQERNRLARDLHDSIKQQIFSIRVASATVEARWATDPEGAQEALTHVRKSAQEAAVEMQALLHQLRPEPLANAGLVEAIREQCEALGYRTGASVEAEVGELPPDEQLPPNAQEALFRVAQEALSNVARHARATRVHVRLGREKDGDLVLEVQDDGSGFDPAQAAGMGLRNMRDRLQSFGGGMEIDSTAGSGSRLTARLPLAGNKTTARPPRAEARTEEIIRLTAFGALAWAFFAAVMPLIPGKVIPLAFFGPILLFTRFISVIRVWPWRSDAVLAGTALPKAFVYCLAFWSVAAGWLEPYTDPFENLNNRTFNLIIGLSSLVLLLWVVQGFFQRLRRTPEATAKGRHIWLTILLLGFFVSLPLISVSGAPYAATGICVILASLFYITWWVRESL